MSSPSSVGIRLEPLGATVEAEPGAALREVLFPYGVEFPCGGHGRCARCRVRVIDGEIAAGADEEAILGRQEIAEGWRLACRSLVQGPATLEIAQWETPILADDSVFAFAPREGRGIAVDLGTTTVVAQLIDLETGHVLGVRSGLNPQGRHGADVMSRVQAASTAAGLRELTRIVRDGVGQLIEALHPAGVGEVVIVGNTVMHHLFCGIDPEPLSHYPFEPADDGLKTFRAAQLGWTIPDDPPVWFLPCLGGFVGSDILAGILACGIGQAEKLTGLLDLGTNGEIVFGNRDAIVCASTAAGPAFEGGRISMGMRASSGAIAGVTQENGRLRCRLVAGGPPRGICGSGLVDAVAVGLDSGRIAAAGRFADGGKEWTLTGPVKLTQRDIRELQLAKAAIAAGIHILLRRCRAGKETVEKTYLAGAFGNYVNRSSARRVGLFDFPLEAVEPAGNTALLGAKLALFQKPVERRFDALRRKIKHVPLVSDEQFEEIYVDSMGFPPPDTASEVAP